MKTKNLLFFVVLTVFSFAVNAQENKTTKAFYTGTVSSVEYVTSLLSRPNDLLPPDNTEREAQDKRSIANQIVTGQDPQTQDDYFVRNRNEMEQSVQRTPASLVFDTYTSSSQPTDPSLAVGPNHVMVVFNTGFAIYNKSGIQLVGPTSPNPAIFPSGGCCDLTVSYDNAADRWVLTFLGSGAQIAVSDGPNPVTAGWYIYTIAAINDYQKLSVWSDGYYITENTGGSNKVWALERAAMLVGSPSAKIQGFNLPGIVTSGFFSPQVLNVTDNNLPAAGGATVIYLQDNAWSGVSTDHIKLWTINVNWVNTANSTISSAQQFNTIPFISVFDNGSFSNLTQPGGGPAIDALQATIMNQAQFRKFSGHNSAVFNFVVDTDASSGERAGVRWYEFRQSGDNQPWSIYQEGTYTAPNGKHAWNASLAMDGQGNIGMGYTSMSGPTTPTTVRVGSFFTGRLSSDPLGTMTTSEEVIANGNANIPGTRYGDYSKLDVDPSDDSSFWFIDEYMNSGRKGVVGKFQIQSAPTDTQPPSNPSSLVASNVTSSGATLNWNASTDNVGVDHYNIFINGGLVGTSTNTTFIVSGLSASTLYNASVNAQDAAGNISVGSATTSFTTLNDTVILSEIKAYYFENGLNKWTDGGGDCKRTLNATYAFEGNYSVRLRDGSSTSNCTSPAIDLTGNSQVSVEFHTYAKGMEAGEDFFVEMYDGSTYQVIGHYITGTDFNNDEFFTDTINLNSGSFNFNANNRIRFRNNANQNNDQIYFDQVIVSGNVVNAPIVIEPTNIVKAFSITAGDKILLYPSPANTVLNIEILDGTFDEITIFSTLGEIVNKLETGKNNISVDVSNLAAGTYFVRFVSAGKAVTKRFIKK